MRVVLGLLLVLLGLCGSAAQEEGFTKVGEIGEFLETTPRDAADESIEHTTKQTTADIWAELRALRDTVSDVRFKLYLLQSDNSNVIFVVHVNRFLCDSLLHKLSDLQTRLSSSERELLVSKFRIEQLEKETADLQTRLSSSESELLDTKSRIDQLEKQNAVQEARLTATEGRTSGLEGESTDLQTRLSSSESELLDTKSRIDQLEKQNAENPKVAFYTALIDSGQIGAFSTEVTLKYSKVFTNIGNAYNPSTGFFTAPVKGVYYLQFTAASYITGYSGVYVFKNNQRIMYNGKLNDGSYVDYFTNSVVLELMPGDKIHLVLPANNYLFDSTDNHSTFSGALLFPL
ncbi:uncharacterized protein AB9W97_009561 [Spinachia spinachia]